MSKELKDKWEKPIKELLMGKKIVGVGYLSDPELAELGWDCSCLAISLKGDDGKMITIYPSMDDEGNGPGALHTTDDDIPIIPVI